MPKSYRSRRHTRRNPNTPPADNDSSQALYQVMCAHPHNSTYTVGRRSGNTYVVHEGVPFYGDGSSTRLGPTDLSIIQPGEWVEVDTGSAKPLIIRRVPVNWATDAIRGTQPFSIIPTDLVENSANDPLLSSIFDSNPSSKDSVLRGPASGSSNEFGVGYGFTQLRAFLRATDMCSVEAMFLDSLLRIKGYNLQMWDAMGEDETMASGDTSTRTTEKSWFLYESLGRNTNNEPRKIEHVDGKLVPGYEDGAAADLYSSMKDRDEQTNKDLNISDYKLDEINQRYEQIQTDRPRILPREVNLHGYLGHGMCDLIVRPGSKRVVDGDVTHVTGMEEDWSKDYLGNISENASIPVLSGLSEIYRGADGRVKITSAKSISLVKDLTIPVPFKKDEDPDTDNSSFSIDLFKDEAPGSPSEAARMGARSDMRRRAHDRSYIDAHPAWVFDREGNGVLGQYLKNHNSVPPAMSKHEHDMPPGVDVQIDPSTKARYYKTKAGLHIGDDGSVVITDGYGSTITMTGGNIYFNCPGDIWNMPGRDNNVWAGRNLNMKSQEDAELVSSNGNVRIKAQVQASVVGGVGGTGGILVQSKASGGIKPEAKGKGKLFSTGGLVIKSDTHVNVKAESVGVIAPKSSIRGKLSVSDVIDTPKARIGVLHAEDGQLSGKVTYVGEPEPHETEKVDGDVDSDGGFISPDTEFTFNTSEEYGILEDYSFNLVESMWQTRARMSNVGGTWVEKAVNGTHPHPGTDIWTSAKIRVPSTKDVPFLWDVDENYDKLTEEKPLSESFVINQ
jgi:hypothetical protein